MYNYTKRYLLILFVLLMPSMNIASKANPEEDRETHSIHKRQLPQEDQDKILSSTKPMTSLEQEVLKDSQDSWQTRLSSSAMKFAKVTGSVVSYAVDTVDYAANTVGYATRTMSKPVMIGLVLASQFVFSDAGCACFCLVNSINPKFFGCAIDTASCIYMCEQQLRFPYGSCPPREKGC